MCVLGSVLSHWYLCVRSAEPLSFPWPAFGSHPGAMADTWFPFYCHPFPVSVLTRASMSKVWGHIPISACQAGVCVCVCVCVYACPQFISPASKGHGLQFSDVLFHSLDLPQGWQGPSRPRTPLLTEKGQRRPGLACTRSSFWNPAQLWAAWLVSPVGGLREWMKETL